MVSEYDSYSGQGELTQKNNSMNTYHDQYSDRRLGVRVVDLVSNSFCKSLSRTLCLFSFLDSSTLITFSG